MPSNARNSRCQVYLHPAATNPRTIAAIQATTGLIVVMNSKRRAALAAPAPTGPWGGDAA